MGLNWCWSVEVGWLQNWDLCMLLIGSSNLSLTYFWKICHQHYCRPLEYRDLKTSVSVTLKEEYRLRSLPGFYTHHSEIFVWLLFVEPKFWSVETMVCDRLLDEVLMMRNPLTNFSPIFTYKYIQVWKTKNENPCGSLFVPIFVLTLGILEVDFK